jgi:hypothetical protein
MKEVTPGIPAHRGDIIVLEVLLLILGINCITFGYFAYKFIQFRKNEKYRTQELNHKVQCLLNQMKQEHESEQEPVSNIFREHVIDELSRQRLVYDEESGKYIKLRRIE